MIFAKGLGHFTIPIGFAIPLAAQFSVSRIWGAEFYTAHDKLVSSLAYFVGALIRLAQ